ncbi:MAG: 3'-5' exonuclease [Alistipes sp.]|nr:3'-5' exonuclease [Alistipes sp.]
MDNYTIFDLETTGLGIQTLEIIEIGALRVRDDRVVDTFQYLVKPRKPIDPRSTAINHITDGMVKNAPGIEHVLPLFADFIGNDIIMGHNINRFDMPIIRRYFSMLLDRNVDNDTFDTLPYAKMRFDSDTSCSLQNLSVFFKLDTKGEHRSIADCYLTKAVYERLRGMKPDKSAHGVSRTRIASLLK